MAPAQDRPGLQQRAFDGAEAARLAMQRFRALRRRQRTSARRKPTEPGISAIEHWGPAESWDGWTDNTE